MQDAKPTFDEFMKRVDALKQSDKMDLSSDQDLSIAVMNLVSIEEHFFFTGAKLGKPSYYDLLAEVREMRKELLGKLVKEPEGEVWCISKHLLAASYRLMEVGTKQLGAGRKDEAQAFFQKAYQLYSLFWGLNLKLISAEGMGKIDEQALANDPKQGGIMGALGTMVRKAIDCCIE